MLQNLMNARLERADGEVLISTQKAGTREAYAECSKVCPWVISKIPFGQFSNSSFAMDHSGVVDCIAVDKAGNIADGDISVGNFPRCGMIVLRP